MNDQRISDEAGRLYKFPAYLKGKIPSIEEFTAALEGAVELLPAGTVYVRAAWGERYVLPQTLTRAYRFGPPRALLRYPSDAIPDGFMYPSRRVRGRPAIAVRSELLNEIRAIAILKCELFKDSVEYRRLSADPLHADPPNSTAVFP